MPQLSTHGHWHATSSIGAVGAAACCARLAGLDAAGVSNALGIAASMASGMVWNFATMTKPLHSGLAAQNGVLAARLAGAGVHFGPGGAGGRQGAVRLFRPRAPMRHRAVRKPRPHLRPRRHRRERQALSLRRAYPYGGGRRAGISARRACGAEQVESIRVGVTSYVLRPHHERAPGQRHRGQVQHALHPGARAGGRCATARYVHGRGRGGRGGAAAWRKRIVDGTGCRLEPRRRGRRRPPLAMSPSGSRTGGELERRRVDLLPAARPRKAHEHGRSCGRKFDTCAVQGAGRPERSRAGRWTSSPALESVGSIGANSARLLGGHRRAADPRVARAFETRGAHIRGFVRSVFRANGPAAQFIDR